MTQTALISGIQRFSTSDGPGIRTTVFVKGCPLRCEWCHNPEMICNDNQLMYSPSKCIGCGNCVALCDEGALSFDGDAICINRKKCNGCMKCTEACFSGALHSTAKRYTVSEIIDIVIKDMSYYKLSKGGMTISGGECLAQPEFTDSLINEAKKQGISVALDTSGYSPKHILRPIAEKVDIILFDLKALCDDVHKEYTGTSNKLILANLQDLASDSIIRSKLWIRMPMIKGVNDNYDILKRTCKYLTDIGIKRVSLLPYHELGGAKYSGLGVTQRLFEPPTDEVLHKTMKMFNKAGIITDISGNSD